MDIRLDRVRGWLNRDGPELWIRIRDVCVWAHLNPAGETAEVYPTPCGTVGPPPTVNPYPAA